MTRTDRLIAIAVFVVVLMAVSSISGFFGMALGAGEILLLLVPALVLTVVIMRSLRSWRAR